MEKKIHQNIDKEEDIEIDNDKIIIVNKGKSKKGKTISWSHDEDENVWTDDEDNTFKIATIGKSNKGKSKIFIASSDNENPLIILDGKEITKKELDKLDSDTIEKVEVLKGDKAIEKHGEKAKDGVIIITTKKKE